MQSRSEPLLYSGRVGYLTLPSRRTYPLCVCLQVRDTALLELMTQELEVARECLDFTLDKVGKATGLRGSRIVRDALCVPGNKGIR